MKPLDKEILCKLSRYRKSLILRAKTLLMKDGWKVCRKGESGKNVMVINDCGQIYHRYFEMDYEDGPCFYTQEDDSLTFDDDMIINELLLISDTIPRLTSFTQQAHELLDEYHDSFNSFDETILEDF